MKKLFKILICTIFLGVNAINPAYCAVLSNQQLSQIIYNNVYNETKNLLKDYSADFKVNISGIPKENYLSRDNYTPKVEIYSQNAGFQAQSYKRVVIKDSKNNTIKAFPINIQTLVYKNVLTAKESIPYGKELKAEDVSIERKEVSKILDKVLTEYKSGLICNRNFQKGTILTNSYLKEKSVVNKNSIVEIIFISKSVKITLQGKALKDGAIGDKIPVKSDKYNKIYTGQINSENEVIVRI